MKIYFCGSIRGGRDDVHLYQKIVRKLQSYGTVLTEHVANTEPSHAGVTRTRTRQLSLVFNQTAVNEISGSHLVRSYLFPAGSHTLYRSCMLCHQSISALIILILPK